MSLDYSSHPADLVPAGQINPDVKIRELRDAIPAHCFKPSYKISLWYLCRDLLLATIIIMAASLGIPRINPPHIRYSVWLLYGCVEGLIMTGIWVLGHECGHGAFSPSQTFNDTIGFTLQSSLLTPYFSWKSSHRRHHIYANNIAKDHNYVPPQLSDYKSSLLFKVGRLEELTDDSPLLTVSRIIMQQLFGFPWYLAANITASPGSLSKPQSTKFLGNSHFLPSSSLFRPEEAHLILLSDIGIGLTAMGLWLAATKLGFHMIVLLYLQPYLWVNHWIVAITYLHHTHPKLPKYEPEAWTFLKGATATVDREFGLIGKYMFHGIIEFHVIHHLFSRIPFYHAEEATNAIIPLLGSCYHADKKRSFLPGIWESFVECQWIEPDDRTANPEDRVMWYKRGPLPPPETSMGKRGW